MTRLYRPITAELLGLTDRQRELIGIMIARSDDFEELAEWMGVTAHDPRGRIGCIGLTGHLSDTYHEAPAPAGYPNGWRLNYRRLWAYRGELVSAEWGGDGAIDSLGNRVKWAEGRVEGDRLRFAYYPTVTAPIPKGTRIKTAPRYVLCRPHGRWPKEVTP